MIEVADRDIYNPPLTRQENRQELRGLVDLPEPQELEVTRIHPREIKVPQRLPRVPSDDEDFMPRTNSTIVLSRPTSRGPSNRTRSKSQIRKRAAKSKASKSRERSTGRKSTRGRKRAVSRKLAESRSRSRSESTGRKPAPRGRGRK
jgi:hypothetical protein